MATITAILTALAMVIAAGELCAQSVQLSEILASNANSGMDNRNKTPDWIELRNASAAPVNLRGWRISDNNNPATAFRLPDTTLAPDGCLLVWASDYVRDVPPPDLVTGASGGIGRWRESDAFHYYYLPVNGDFTASVRIHTLTGGTLPEAGLIVREENKPASRYVGLLAQPDGDVFEHISPTTVQGRDNLYFSLGQFPGAVQFPYIWLKIRRTGDTIVGYTSLDSSYWHEGLHRYFPLAAKGVTVGLAVVSGSDSVPVVAGFSGFRLDGRDYAAESLNYLPHGCRAPAELRRSREIHAPFALSQNGETVYLWTPDGELADTLKFGPQRRNISYGKDRNGVRGYFSPPTPGKNTGYPAAAGVVPDPATLINSGYQAGPFSLNIVPYQDTAVQIRYTTDLSVPTEQSYRYRSSLQVLRTATLRLRAFRKGWIPSRTINRTFVFDQPPAAGISTLFLTAEPAELFSDSIGILAKGRNADTAPPYYGANFWGDREARVHAELNDGGREIFSADMGARNHGFAGRYHDQQPLDIQLSSPYGDGVITENVFPEKNASGITKLLLRNGSQDWPLTMLRDPLASLLALRLGLEAQGYRPARVYINGAYWGLYQLREKSDDSFIASNFGVSDDAVELIGTLGRPLQGSSAAWSASVAAAADSALVNDSVFAAVAAPFDLKNFIRYWLFEIYAMNTDWPGNNLKAWREPERHPLWRFIVLDNDLSFAAAWDPNFNMFDYVRSPVATMWANQPEATALFRGFIRNAGFRNRLLSRLADFLNTSLSAESAARLLDSLAAQIAPEIPLQQERWPGSVPAWEQEVQRLREFLAGRPALLRQHAIVSFGLPGLSSVSVHNSVQEAGALRVNSIAVNNGAFDGVYFRGVPLVLSAYPDDRYEFLGWKYAAADTMITAAFDVSIEPKDDSIDIVALYRRSDRPGDRRIVINEIMYKPHDSADSKDWIELYNPARAPQNLSGWTLKDEDNDHTFTLPEGTVIAPEDYLVIVADSTALRRLHPAYFQVAGQFDFGFGRGDAVRLYDAAGHTVDSVRYERFTPWPAAADGGGSLELVAPELDNSVAQNWRVSLPLTGTPGRRNSVYLPQSAEVAARGDFRPAVYPNPATEAVHITAGGGRIRCVEIITPLGAVVAKAEAVAGHGVTFTVAEWPSGVYSARITSDNTTTAAVQFIITR